MNIFRNTYCLLTIVLVLTGVRTFAQKSLPLTYRHYPLVVNLDSLEKAVLPLKNNPSAYLRGLITLEKNRTEYLDVFGEHLTAIETLAKQQRDPLATATYHYLKSLSVKDNNLGAACRHILEAIRYFERTKDTTGILNCYYTLLSFNVIADVYKINKMQSRDHYYDRMMELGHKSDDVFHKLMRIRAILSFEKLVKGTQDFTKSKAEVETALNLMAKNPNTEPVWPSVYVGIASLYQRHNQSQTALTYGLKAHELFKKKSPKPCVTSFYNTAAIYHAAGNYKEAEPLLTETITILEPLKDEKYNLLINAYLLLSNIQYKTKRYELAWASKQKQETWYIKRYSSLKGSLFEELQTQYEINQKDAENRLLIEKNKLAEVSNQKLRQETEIRLLTERNKLIESQNQSYQKEAQNRLLMQQNLTIEASNRQYQLLLAVSAFALLAVSLLIYLLLRSNRKQKELIAFRDKFYTIIAHDLRDPINNMMRLGSLLPYLIKNSRGEDIQTVIQQIDQMGRQTSLLLNNLTEWGKNSYFEQKSLPQLFDATAIIQELSPMYAVFAETKGIALSVTVPDHFWVRANPKDMSLIVRNLLDNALKNTPNGGKVELIAATEPLSAPESGTAQKGVITVHNTGEGFAPAQLTYLQAVFAGKRKPQVGVQGLGLGLVLIHDFAKKNGFSVRLTGSEGQGATFALSIG
jgi:signal transduction histidine kinase